MKSLLLAAALLLSAAPAQAGGFPQWLPVSSDQTMKINYNSVRSTAEGIKSVDANLPTVSGTLHVSCKAWKYSAQGAGAFPSEWRIIPPNSAVEAAAYILCPGPMQQAYIKQSQALNAGVPVQPAAVDDGMVHMNGKSYQTVGEAMCDPAFYNVLINNCPNKY